MSEGIESSAKYSNGYALVVGVGKYKHEHLSVEATANDAEDIAKVLKSFSFCAYPEEQVLGPLTNGEATKDNILKKLDELYEKTKEDSNATVLIFFSGHGWNEKKQYYFLPYDTEVIKHTPKTKKVESINVNSAIPNSELVEKFRKFSTSKSVKRLAIFFNTCFSGGLGIALSPEIADSSQLQPIPFAAYNNLLQRSGRCIVTSSKEDQRSWIKKGARNSIFTEQLIAGLKGKGGGDLDTNKNRPIAAQTI